MNHYKQLIFSSRPNDNFSQKDLLNLMALAQERNTQKQISGLLVFHNNHFLQFTEGAKKKVDSLFEKIQRDPRHTDIKILHQQHSPVRLLPTWVMACSGDLLQSAQNGGKEFLVSVDEARHICQTMPDVIHHVICHYWKEHF